MSRTKDFRIHQKKRLTSKRKKYNIVFESQDPKYIGKVCETPAFCDCGYCKNPKWYYSGNSAKAKKFCDLKRLNVTKEDQDYIEDQIDDIIYFGTHSTYIEELPLDYLDCDFD